MSLTLTTIKILPSYTTAKLLKSGEVAYFWTRPVWAKQERHGRKCPVHSEALGTDLAIAIGKADLVNKAFSEWRLGIAGQLDKDSVKGLFAWYRQQDRFKKGTAKYQRDMRAYMSQLEAHQLKTKTFGELKATDVQARHVDKIYAALQKESGVRAATYAMQICRRVWNEAVRHKDKTKIEHNPFAKMGMKTTAQKGNVAATREQYNAFRETAREMGHQSMATAAALAFELVQSKTDVFGFDFGDHLERGFFWEDYVPGVSFALRRAKTDNPLTIPLSATDEDGGSIPLYPELEAELARHTRRTGYIVLNEVTKERYREDFADKLFRRIRDKAGLPKEITFTSFKHGGATELGDAGVFDIRPISGHKTLQQTATYNKANESKARSAGKARRKLVRTNDQNVVRTKEV